MKLLIIAWRNLWRNKKRTLLTMASVVFAIFFAIIMRSQQLGMYDNAIDNVITLETGHIQIQGKGFQETNSIDDGFLDNKDLFSLLNEDARIEKTIARISGFGMASTGLNTKETMVMGMEIAKDGDIFTRNISAGEMIDDSSNAIVIGEVLAKYLKVIRYDVELELESDSDQPIKLKIDEDSTKSLKIGGLYNNSKILAINKTPIIIKDSVVILGAGYHGASAAGIYKVKGILKLPLPDMNKRLIVMNIRTCQSFLHADGVLASVNVHLKSKDDLDAVYADLKSNLDPELYEVYKWKHLNEELVQQIDSDNKSGLIFMAILYLIIGFGILGTIIMMTNERKKEFAVMIALGMKKGKLNLSMIAEDLYIAMLGSLVGVIISIPAVLALHYNPIPLTDEVGKTMEDMGWEPVVPFAADAGIFLSQSMVVIIIFAFASIYPLIKIKNLNVIKSIRG